MKRCWFCDGADENVVPHSYVEAPAIPVFDAHPRCATAWAGEAMRPTKIISVGARA